jgi:VWFA-related protein
MNGARGRRASGLLAALLIPSIAAAQPEEGVVFPDRIEVEVVNLQVWVTDPEGRPVVALQTEDFELLIDGEPEPITHFSEIRSERTGGPFAPARPREPPAPPPAPPTEDAEPGEPPPPAPRALEVGSLIVYFDELHLGRLERKQVVADLRAMIEAHEVEPQRVMILRQGTRLTAEASFGSTRDHLDRVLDRLARPPAGQAAPADKRWVVQQLWDLWESARQRTNDRDPCAFFVREGAAKITAWARDAAWRSRLTAGQLTDVAELLGGIPGTKTVLYLGDALDLTPGADLFEMVRGLCPYDASGPPSQIGAEELTGRFERVASAANAGRVTIHTLQAGGLRTGALGGPDQRSTDPRAPGLKSSFEAAMRAGDRSGLEVLAARTGGSAVVNRNRFDRELSAIARDVGSYYSLGFSPGRRFDRGEHRVEVRTRHRGLEVRHRPELRLKSPRERLDELVLTSIYLGVAPNTLDLRLAHGDLRVAGGEVLLPVRVLVPVDRIAYLPLGGGPPSASLEIAVHGRSPDQAEGPAVRRTFRFEKPAETSGRAELEVEIPLGPGLHVVGVGVRDQITGETSAVATTIGLQPPPEQPSE